MTPEQWQEVQKIFWEVLDLPEEDRCDHIEQACKDRKQLRLELEAMLARYQANEREDTDGSLASPLFPPPPELPRIGEIVGRYEIVDSISVGGCGAVYRAIYRVDDVELEVALKVLLPEMLSPRMRRLFRDERRILASLVHPNIARILDGGNTESGLPYLVMEFIQGQRLDEYCDSRHLGLNERLKLFRKVCAAVQFAHQKRVVHLDLKPSNILVTEEGEPKLLDFGVAQFLESRLLSQVSADSMADPRALGKLPMTLPYASPEQVQARNIDTTSDVYTLGVILYELLTGQTPYRCDRKSLTELIAAIIYEKPEKPSVALRKTPPEIALKDETTRGRPAAMENPPKTYLIRPRQLAGDIDCIVSKALEKEKENRYSSPKELADDLRRYLDGQPVEARSPHVAYLVGKLIGRHKIGTGAALLMLVVIFGSASMFLTMRQERVVFEYQLMLYDLLQDTNSLEDIPAIQQALKTRTGDGIFLAENLNDTAWQLEQDGEFKVAEPLYREALAMKKRIFPKSNDSLALSLNNLAANLAAQGHYIEAEELYRESLAIRRKGSDPISLTLTLNNLAVLLQNTGRLEEAQDLFEESFELRREHLGPDHHMVGSVHNNLAFLQQLRGRLQDAEEHYEKALAIFETAFGEQHQHYARVLRNRSILRQAQDKTQEAAEDLDQALAVFRDIYQNWQIADAENVLGGILLAQGLVEEAATYICRSYEVLLNIKGPEARQTREARTNVAALQDVGKSCGPPRKIASKSRPSPAITLAIYAMNHSPGLATLVPTDNKFFERNHFACVLAR